YGLPPTAADFLDRDLFTQVLLRAMKGSQTILQDGWSLDQETGRQSMNMDAAKRAEYAKWRTITQVEQDHIRGATLGKSIAGLFEALAEEHLIQPTIIYDFPL